MAEPKGKKRGCQHPDCKWRAPATAPNGCDYTYITGKNRLAGLPREKWAPCYCDKYEPGARARRPREDIVIEKSRANTFQGKISKVEEKNASGVEMLKKLHKEGLSDPEIARQLDWTKARVVYWREKLGLLSNIKRSETRYDLELCAKLYEEGKKDREIAEAIGSPPATVRQWRGRRGLPPNP